jgi:hypothetical protein
MLSALDAGLDIQPLIEVFEVMVDLRIKAMPPDVQLRYLTSK